MATTRRPPRHKIHLYHVTGIGLVSPDGLKTLKKSMAAPRTWEPRDPVWGTHCPITDRYLVMTEFPPESKTWIWKEEKDIPETDRANLVKPAEDINYQLENAQPFLETMLKNDLFPKMEKATYRWSHFEPVARYMRGTYMHAWTTTKALYEGRPGFIAMEYRLDRQTGDWNLKRASVFRLRWKAKDRAWRWHCQREGRPFNSLHVPPKMTKERLAALRKNARDNFR